jgi:hypothetical protein
MTPRGLKRSVCGLFIVTSLTLIEVSTVRAEGVLGLSTTATNALGGGMLGAGAGAIIGHQTHHTAAGAVDRRRFWSRVGPRLEPD